MANKSIKGHNRAEARGVRLERLLSKSEAAVTRKMGKTTREASRSAGAPESRSGFCQKGTVRRGKIKAAMITPTPFSTKANRMRFGWEEKKRDCVYANANSSGPTRMNSKETKLADEEVGREFFAILKAEATAVPE